MCDVCLFWQRVLVETGGAACGSSGRLSQGAGAAYLAGGAGLMACCGGSPPHPSSLEGMRATEWPEEVWDGRQSLHLLCVSILEQSEAHWPPSPCVLRASTCDLFGRSMHVLPSPPVGRHISAPQRYCVCYLNCRHFAILSLNTLSLRGRGHGILGDAEATRTGWQSSGARWTSRARVTSRGTSMQVARPYTYPFPIRTLFARTPRQSALLHACGGPHSLSAYSNTTSAYDASIRTR